MSSRAITVLMSVYNGGTYLKTAIESILNQSFSDFEFLIIDDASSDKSVEIILSYQDSRIRFIRNETNIGQTRSLNKGLSLANGRYIARVDADDFAFPTWLERSLAFLETNPANALVSCQALVIDENSKIQKVLYAPSSYEQMILRSLTATPVNHVGALYKKDEVASLGGYGQNFKIAADFDLWSKMIRQKVRLALVDEVLVAVRVHQKSASSIERGRADMVEICQIIKENINQLTSFLIKKEEVELLWKLHYAPDQMSAEDFTRALDLLEKAYQSIRPEFGVSKKHIQKFFSRRKKVFYAKRALAQILDDKFSELRALAKRYCQKHGLLNIFSLFWLGTWLGRPIIKSAPRVFNNLNGFCAQRRLKEQWAFR